MSSRGSENFLRSQIEHYRNKIEACKQEAKEIASRLDEPNRDFVLHLEQIILRMGAVAAVIRSYDAEIDRLSVVLVKI